MMGALVLVAASVGVVDLTPAQLQEELRKASVPVVVNVWATWCRPCVEEFPEILEFARNNQGNVKVMLVSADFSSRRELVEKFLRERGVGFVTYLIEMLPIVYTPTVGQACLLLSRIMRRARGVYIHPDNIAAIDTIFANVPLPEVQLIVVTDGERILGLGDLGADGMGIPVGKVSLYVAAGGLHPACCLPVCLDVGTNNDRLLADPLYLGFRRRRLEGEDYDRFVERFVLGVKRNFPNALIQWEDFAKHKAFRLLERYRERIPSFNDDIQGTGATALAALLTASRIKQKPLAAERVVIVGFGQAGVGTAKAIATYLQSQGLPPEEARKVVWPVDVQGLLCQDDPSLEPWQRPFARKREEIAGWKLKDPQKITLEDVVVNVKPTILVGVTAQPGLFSTKLLQQVAKEEARPVILALSNPTSKSECTPEDALAATGGRALVATGSPFPPVSLEDRTVETSQCNNLYVFPGVGLGTLVAKAPKITDEMFLAASEALSAMVSAEEQERGLLLPPLTSVRQVAREVAVAVAKKARDQGLGRLLADEEIEEVVSQAQWEPRFVPYRPGRPS
jgi:malate dehydrogenase (oxaloacetate-decarboxylating)